MKSSTQQRKGSTNGNGRAQEVSPVRERTAELEPLGDLRNYARRYFREQPEMSALACLGIGFILGWKLKPW
ncbi:MAG: hypothetical protein U0903_01910 [Planctomycetales bacterium]